MIRRATTVGLAGLLSWALLAGPSGAVIPAAGVISKKNVEWVFNVPSGVGGDIEFYETKLADGSLKRYAIYTSMANGFNIADITNPELPVLTGAFVDPGVNWQGDIQIDPVRKIVVLATQGSIGFTVSHGGGDGLAFVSIADPAQPTLLGVANGLGSAAHNSTIIGDNIVYTTGSARMVDYTNATSPQDLGQIAGMCSGHDITVDPNNPGIAYNACGSPNTEIWDVSNPRQPVKLSTIRDTRISIAHQADPSPDSKLLFITDERGGGLTNAFAPGGGVHVYDISGVLKEGASLETPIKVGQWFPPFHGVATSDTQAGPWGNVTAHNMTFQAERYLLSIAWYSMGSWVTDLQHPTNDTGPYLEWQGNQFGEGGTTWGNTQGNFLPEGAETWSTKWTRFDDPAFDRYLFTSDITRGMDVLRYTGAMPQKIARLAVDEAATGGDVTGVLDRYAVWTYEGFVNKPLAGKTLTVKVDGGPSVTTTSGDDGSFSADLNLAAGTHDVTVTWADPSGVYQTASVTQTITA